MESLLKITQAYRTMVHPCIQVIPDVSLLGHYFVYPVANSIWGHTNRCQFFPVHGSIYSLLQREAAVYGLPNLSLEAISKSGLASPTANHVRFKGVFKRLHEFALVITNSSTIKTSTPGRLNCENWESHQHITYISYSGLVLYLSFSSRLFWLIKAAFPF